MASGTLNLPPGFSFSPTDEQLLLHFLYPKTSLPSHPTIIPDLDLSLHDPWHLNGIYLSTFIICNLYACMYGSNMCHFCSTFHIQLVLFIRKQKQNYMTQKKIKNHTCFVCLGKALSSGNQHYFFSRAKENRSTENGYWKEIGVTEAVVSASEKVGMKKYLVFNLGEAPQGTETSWVMQEFHICSSSFTTASTRGRRKSVSH